ncbi:MAG: hypothetical protein EP338_14155 [Bacteroidetes bacterium]|nr:MAG: hypothetical protein EP338_14155 [Bacteroidota bacterium]
MMKKSVYVVAISAMALSAFVSCEKESASPKNKVSEEKIPQRKVLHFVDGKEVSQETFMKYNNLGKEDLYVYVSPLGAKKEVSKEEITYTGKPLNPGKKEEKEPVVLVESFTTQEGYVRYGIQNGLKVKEQLAFEKEMREYAEKTGAVKYYEKTGEAPKSYVKYEKEAYKKYFGHAQDKSYITTLYKDYFGGPSWTMVGYMPFMPPGWNNTVSSYTPVGIYGFTILYDNSFYRNRMATFWGWGFTRYLLYWGWTYYLNDRTSSVLSH